jgi:exopolysaccharide biosynthesis protein
LFVGAGYRLSNWLSVGLKAKVIFGNYVVRNHTALVSDDNEIDSYYKRSISINGNQISGGLLIIDPDGRYSLAAVVEWVPD